MPKYCFLFLLFFSTNALNAQNFRDFVKKIDIDSINSKLSQEIESIDELITLITLIKSGSYYDDFNFYLPKVKYLSDSLNVDWGENMYNYLQGLTFDIKQKDSAALYFVKSLSGFRAARDTSGIIMCNLKLYNLHFDIISSENSDSKFTSKYKLEFEQMTTLSKHPHDRVIRNWFMINFNQGVRKISLKEIEKLYDESIELIENNKDLDSYRLILSNAMQMEYSRLGLAKEYLIFTHKTYLENKIRKTKFEDVVTINYAYALYANNDVKNAIKYFRLIVDSFDIKKSMVPDVFALACTALINEFSSKGQFKEAFEFVAVRDSFTHYINEKQRQKDLLIFEQNLEISNRTLKTGAIIKERNLFKNGLIVFGVLLIIVLILITRLYFIKNKLNQAKSFAESILYILAHDLKSPLLAFSMALKRMTKQLQENKTEEAQEDLKHLRVSSINGIHLIENLLGLHTNYVLEKENISLKKFVFDSLQHLWTITKLNNITTNIEISEDLEVSTYRVHLAQILRNLVDNAIKHAGCTEIILSGYKDSNKVVINVHDNGTNYPYAANAIVKMIEIINDDNNQFQITNGQLGTRIIKAGLNKLNSKLSFKREGEWSIFSFVVM